MQLAGLNEVFFPWVGCSADRNGLSRRVYALLKLRDSSYGGPNVRQPSLNNAIPSVKDRGGIYAGSQTRMRDTYIQVTMAGPYDKERERFSYGSLGGSPSRAFSSIGRRSQAFHNHRRHSEASSIAWPRLLDRSRLLAVRYCRARAL